MDLGGSEVDLAQSGIDLPALCWMWVDLGEWVNLVGSEMDLGGYGVDLVVLLSG